MELNTHRHGQCVYIGCLGRIITNGRKNKQSNLRDVCFAFCLHTSLEDKESIMLAAL